MARAKKPIILRRSRGVLYKMTSAKGYNAFSGIMWQPVKKKKK